MQGAKRKDRGAVGGGWLERRQPFRWVAVTVAGTGGTYARFRELNTVDVAESNCYWDVPAEIDWTGTIVSVQLPPREHKLILAFPPSVSHSECRALAGLPTNGLYSFPWFWIFFTVISFYGDVGRFCGCILYALRGTFWSFVNCWFSNEEFVNCILKYTCWKRKKIF